MPLRSRGLRRLCDKLKTFYLHYHNANVHQTCESGLLPSRSHMTLWSHGLASSRDKLKKSVCPLPQCLPLPYLEGWLLTLKGCYWYSHMILQSHDFVWSPEKLIPCVFYHSTCGQQTWQVSDISWGAPTHKVTSFFNHAIWWGQMTKLNTIYLH